MNPVHRRIIMVVIAAVFAVVQTDCGEKRVLPRIKWFGVLLKDSVSREPVAGETVELWTNVNYYSGSSLNENTLAKAVTDSKGRFEFRCGMPKVNRCNLNIPCKTGWNTFDRKELKQDLGTFFCD